METRRGGGLKDWKGEGKVQMLSKIVKFSKLHRSDNIGSM